MMSHTFEYKLVTTRKEHKCWSCLRRIPAKSKMYKWACVDSGDFNNGYTCETCDEIIDLLNKEERWDGYYDHGYIEECLLNQTPEQYLEELKSKP